MIFVLMLILDLVSIFGPLRLREFFQEAATLSLCSFYFVFVRLGRSWKLEVPLAILLVGFTWFLAQRHFGYPPEAEFKALMSMLGYLAVVFSSIKLSERQFGHD
jgi:hypothetical protein